MRILRLDDDIHEPMYCILKRGKLVFYSLNELLAELAKPHKEEYELSKKEQKLRNKNFIV